MNISQLVDQLSGELDENASWASDLLAQNGSEQVVNEMIKLLDHPHDESKIMASRTLGLIEKNDTSLEPLMLAIDNNPSIASELFVSLEGFDLSSNYVPVFKYYLFGGFKVSSLARHLLDHKQFTITQRVLKKARKAWNQYEHNVKHDDAFELKKSEVEIILDNLCVELERK